MGQPKTARSRTVKAESVMLRSCSQKRMDHFRCSVAQLLTTPRNRGKCTNEAAGIQVMRRCQTMAKQPTTCKLKATKLPIPSNKKIFCGVTQKGRGNGKAPKASSKPNDDRIRQAIAE